MPPVYVVEHLDQELYRWSCYEYLSMIEYVKPNRVIFSNSSFPVPPEWGHLTNFETTCCSVSSLPIPRQNICLLDSESPEPLTPEDASTFTHFLFGGILGNTDEFDFDRTRVLREMGFPTRNLGSVQMSTDTALKVTKEIIEHQTPFDKLCFVDRPTIKSHDKESLILNFRFLADANGEPLMAEGIRELMLEDVDEFDLGRLE